jgi:hypothetical protein
MLPDPLDYRSLADHRRDRRSARHDHFGDTGAMLLDLIGVLLASVGALLIWFVAFVSIAILLSFLMRF